jgi:hypothetical protein
MTAVTASADPQLAMRSKIDTSRSGAKDGGEMMDKWYYATHEHEQRMKSRREDAAQWTLVHQNPARPRQPPSILRLILIFVLAARGLLIR